MGASARCFDFVLLSVSGQAQTCANNLLSRARRPLLSLVGVDTPESILGVALRFPNFISMASSF